MDFIANVNASQPEHTPAGNLLCRMYYGPFLDKALSREERSGYPHNGGEHTLHLRLAPKDLKSFLDLVLETFSQHPGAVEFVNAVKANFANKYPRQPAI